MALRQLKTVCHHSWCKSSDQSYSPPFNWKLGYRTLFGGPKTPATMVLEKLLKEETLITKSQRYWDGVRSKAASLGSDSLVPYEDSQSL